MGYAPVRVVCDGKGCRLRDRCTNTVPHDLTYAQGQYPCSRSPYAETTEVTNESSTG